MTDYRLATGIVEILNVAAYMAWNYSRTLVVSKGPHNAIPKGARILSRPQNSLPGQPWTKVGKIALVSPATTSWRKAVARYAAAHGQSLLDGLRWIWPKRRLIREYLVAEDWRGCCVSGLDGHNYQIWPEDEDYLGNEIYRVTSEEGRSFFLTENALEQLASLQVIPCALPKSDTLDFTTGETANCKEMLGMHAFMRSIAVEV